LKTRKLKVEKQKNGKGKNLEKRGGGGVNSDFDNGTLW